MLLWFFFLIEVWSTIIIFQNPNPLPLCSINRWWCDEGLVPPQHRTFSNGVSVMGVRGAIWFGFEVKSHPNHKINKYAVWFGSVDF